MFLEAINKYYWERLERNNVVLELNCAFQKTDIFEPFSLEYKLSESRDGEVELMTQPFVIDHQEGDIISIVFVDARLGTNTFKVGAEVPFQHVTQYTVGIFLSEDASDNSVDGVLQGLVGLRN